MNVLITNISLEASPTVAHLSVHFHIFNSMYATITASLADMLKGKKNQILAIQLLSGFDFPWNFKTRNFLHPTIKIVHV